MGLSRPDGFELIYKAVENPGPRKFSVIGVVSDLLPPRQSNDWIVSFKIIDDSWVDGEGLQCRFFARNESKLPNLKSNGDIIIIHRAWLKDVRGQRTVTGTASATDKSSWVVIHQDDIPESDSFTGDLTFTKKSDDVAPPGKEFFEYATWLYNKQGRAMYDHPNGDHPNLGANKNRSNDQPFKPADKFKLVENLTSPAVKPKNQFADLMVEVRRIWDGGSRVEMVVTDYTSHADLRNYARNSEGDENNEGDEYGYTKNSTPWAGPWGRRSMTVAAWDSHGAYVREKVRLGCYLRLSNVYISYGSDGAKMEGNIRVSIYDPTRVCITVMKAAKANSDVRLRDLLVRKEQYEKGPDCQGMGEIKTRKRPIEDEEVQAPQPANDQTDKPLSRNQKRKIKKKAKEQKDKDKASATGAPGNPPNLATGIRKDTLNPHIRFNKVPDHVTPVTIAEILDAASLESSSKTALGNSFSLPFMNNLYHVGRVRVVDFHPPDLADFAAPIREHKDSNSPSSSGDLDSSDDDMMDVDATGSKEKWEWRFELLIEDASISQLGATRQKGKMKLLVAGQDADFLLRSNATDLRRDKQALSKLRQKLFLLWGDLEERKSEERENPEAGQSKGNGDADTVSRESCRPFACTVKEYGVKANDRDDWERIFSIFSTTIQG